MKNRWPKTWEKTSEGELYAKLLAKYEGLLIKYENLQKDHKLLEDENHKLSSIFIVKNKVENFEEDIDGEITLPSKETMILELSGELTDPLEKKTFHYLT